MLASKSLHELAKKILEQAREREEIHAFMVQPARDVLRAPTPTERFTTGQMVDMLGLVMLVTALVEKYARGLKGT